MASGSKTQVVCIRQGKFHSKRSTLYALRMDGEQGRLGEVTLLDVRGRVGKAPKDSTGYVRTVYEGLRADYQVPPQHTRADKPARASVPCRIQGS